MDDLINLKFEDPVVPQYEGWNDNYNASNMDSLEDFIQNFKKIQKWANDINTLPTPASPEASLTPIPAEGIYGKRDYDLGTAQSYIEANNAQQFVDPAQLSYGDVNSPGRANEFYKPDQLFPLENVPMQQMAPQLLSDQRLIAATNNSNTPSRGDYVKIENESGGESVTLSSDESHLAVRDEKQALVSRPKQVKRGPRESTRFFNAVKDRFPRPSDLTKGLAELGCDGSVNTDFLVKSLSKCTRYNIDKKLRSALKLDKPTEDTHAFVERIYGNMRAERCYKKKTEKKMAEMNSSKKAKNILKDSLKVVSTRYTADAELQSYVMGQLQSALSLLDATSGRRALQIVSTEDSELRQNIRDALDVANSGSNGEKVKERITALIHKIDKKLDPAVLDRELAQITEMIDEDEGKIAELEDTCLLLVNSKLLSSAKYRGPLEDADHSSMSCYEKRLSTYTNWPHESKETLKKTALAGNGFYCQRHFLWNDSVVCFSCGLQLCRFDGNEDVMETHRSLSPDCSFCNSNK